MIIHIKHKAHLLIGPVSDVYLLGRQGVYLVKISNTSNYLAILTIMSTVIITLVPTIMMIKMKTASSRWRLHKATFAEIHLATDCTRVYYLPQRIYSTHISIIWRIIYSSHIFIIYHGEFILHIYLLFGASYILHIYS